MRANHNEPHRSVLVPDASPGDLLAFPRWLPMQHLLSMASDTGGNVTKLQRIADKYRLRIRRDECGDEIIPGRRGHLYVDNAELCLMVLDGPRMLKSRWEALGGKLWMGAISEGVQDVKVIGIPEENTKPAIRMVGCKAKRVMSDAQKAALAKAQESSPLAAQMQRRSVESLGDGQVDV